MPEYEVTFDVTRSLTCTVKGRVIADNDNEAYDYAMELATSGGLSDQLETKWDISHTDFEIVKTEQQSENDE